MKAEEPSDLRSFTVILLSDFHALDSTLLFVLLE